MRTTIMVCTKDRPTELYGLLLSLRTQSYQNWDLAILDDGSGTPVQNFYFIQYLSMRLRYEGHKVHIIRNDRPTGVSKARQKLAEYAIEHFDNPLLARIDDDTFLEPDYFEKLLKVIDEGYDLASGVTPPVANPTMGRESRFVQPVINRVVLDEKGGFLINNDSCGHTYLEDSIVLTDHFRSCALYKREVHDKVKYDDCPTPHGFREEEFFSFRMILSGFKLGVHTTAIAWHLLTPSGGERTPQQGEHSYLNQKMLNRRTRQWFEQYGDFIEDYHRRNGIVETRKEKLADLEKNCNLIYLREE